MKIVWTPQALRSRQEIRRYIAADDLAAALVLDELFRAKALQLVLYPSLGRPGRVHGTRELMVHRNYILVYQLSVDSVRILHVLHAARRWPPGSR
ncbi:MAG: type II toxin-antitoxin system mRNA interferase toxin, RelE/StbE family [Tistrella sp.]|uniref:Type II toxin-antitoxin system mRNA interferase toxin, RelE/StbE family n=1 Tax=Tistrella mobilis TaxID=171437 RepID=A0A3B9IIY1_9PROT|nr:type II toxin-antitoxin system RelE/ParE family toxin [Tistrella sp.]MAD40258.1 type II toxin-antitoxin system mRNA interferase toxin, RelE/StbE family [Tistrella sp.]MBA73959.1 type II toxin-antitoxin system mRNA interferase toxin, RelE/StbE family [Tistrella sp.]HAE47283.1 type II toxin-antitoxin system mRNA interferase toxin, RelE/StbE family [Tistrella mobilis]